MTSLSTYIRTPTLGAGRDRWTYSRGQDQTQMVRMHGLPVLQCTVCMRENHRLGPPFSCSTSISRHDLAVISP